jgi:syndecan 4
LCFCDADWKGSTCNIKRQPCPRSCSGHGHCDDTFGVCTCDPLWTERDCNTVICQSDCNGRGRCDNGTCICTRDWMGASCDLRACAVGCETNGRCDNGTCLCNQGWKGNDCLTDACPNNCNNGNGTCVKDKNGIWHCVCNSEYRGYGCEIGEILSRP